MNHPIRNNNGFTRLDLMAVIAVISLLFFSILPAAGKSRSGFLNSLCLANKRLLMQSVLLYANDNDGWLPPNSDLGDPSPGNAWLFDSTGFLPSATNALYFNSPRYSALAPYLGGNIAPFKCPADKNQLKSGLTVATSLRSVSMNCAVGTARSFFGAQIAKEATPGGWLDGKHTHGANRDFYCYGRVSDVVNPKPSALWVMVDEAPDTMNDACFGFVGPGLVTGLVDRPASFHDAGAGFGFMDGHAEIKFWMDRRTTTVVPLSSLPQIQAGNPDLEWLGQHGTAPVPKNP